MIGDPCGCRDPSDLPLARITNRPALPSIRYRIGTYATFRRSMLAELTSRSELQEWQVRQGDDYGIAFIDMWAYLSDILTFYQERIANESFLRTATQQESVATLAETIDYKPAPGMAAQTYLAFDAEKDKQVSIPVGLKVQSVPGQNEKPQKFETMEAITAHSSLNRIGLQLRQPQVIYPSATTLVLAGTNTRLAVGDPILILVEGLPPQWERHVLTGVEVDPSTQTTTVHWSVPVKIPFAYLFFAQVFVFRQQASLFGHNAPDWQTIPDSWKLDTTKDPHAGIYANWNLATLPEDTNHKDQVYLDRVYQQVLDHTWMILISEEPSQQGDDLFKIDHVASSSRVNYTLSATVTRLTLESTPADTTFSIHSTRALIQAEPLTLADLPIDTVSGGALTLDGAYPDLLKGARILLKGERSTGEVVTEVLQVDNVDLNQGVITLHNSLGQYKAATVTLYGNVALGGHGETVPEEPLGNGDASAAFQAFTLPKSPVTFVPHAGSPHGAKNTLVLSVGGVEWQEVPSLYGRGPAEPVYTTNSGKDRKMTLTFGDGATGARLPSGQNNVTAAYRRGIGTDGNVRPGTLTNLLDRPLGLSSVINPDRADGGADAERLEQTRLNAPNTVRTFGRIVSLQDFQDAAREYSGIEKARAVLARSPAGEQFVELTVAGFAGQLPGHDVLAVLKADLDSRRDPNQRLVVHAGQTTSICVSVAVDHAANRKASDVQAAVRQALLDYLAWDNVDFGQTIELSDVYRVVQDVAGVNGARITRLNVVGSAGVLPTIPIDATHLPVLAATDVQLDDWTPEA